MTGWIQALVLCLGAPLALTGIPRNKQISPYIRHYEVLTYNADRLHEDHRRAKREVGSSHLVYLNFSAHNKDFKLRLQQHSSIFVEEPELEIAPGHVVPLDISHIYEGDLIGESKTHVHGSIINGVFAGRISTPSESYTVERSDVYFKDPHNFHSIIYGDSHMDIDPHRSKRSTEKGFCGADIPDIKKWMREQKNSLLHEMHKSNSLFKDTVQDSTDSERGSKHDSGTLRQDGASKTQENPAVKYLQHKQRSKREVLTKGMCNLYMRSDSVLWDRYNGSGTHGLKYNAERSRKEITSLFSQMVSEVNLIYNNVDFSNTDKSISYQGISLKIHRVKINETSRDCPEGSNTRGKPLCKPNIDVHNFLNYNSLENNNEFCLAYTVTFRDFDGGTLGLAWTGDAGEAPGGICDTYKQYQTLNGNIVWKGLNTGIVSLINYNVPVAPKVAYLTLGHEIGHNFGSPHDYPSSCVPYTANQDPNGNYIMYASATTGDQVNNKKFSECSKRNISLVLDSVVKEKYNKKNCLLRSGEAFCGNQIPEGKKKKVPTATLR